MDGKDKIVAAMEELGMDSNQIHAMLEKIKNINMPIAAETPDKEFAISQLKNELITEKDWRRRASIAARIASMGFED